MGGKKNTFWCFWCMISGPARVDCCNVSQIEGGDKGPYKSCSHHGAILAICSRRNHFWPIPTKSLVEQVLPIMWAVKVIQMNLRIDQRSIRRYKKRGILKRYVLKRNFGEKSAAHHQQAHHQVLRNVTELIFEGGAAAATGAGACCATTRKSCAATFEHFYVFSVQNQSFFPYIFRCHTSVV